MRANKTQEVKLFIYEQFCALVDLSTQTLLASEMTLGDVLASSPKLVNSVDLMECFARTGNAVKRSYGVRVRLPAFPLNTKVSTLVDTLVEQITTQFTQEEVPCQD